jgi:hypothetical protein
MSKFLSTVLGERGKQSGVRLVIYGTHSSDWTAALAPEAPVWSLLPAVKEVLTEKQGEEAISQLPLPGLETVVLPLMEAHVENCPRTYPTLIPSVKVTRLLRDKSRFADYSFTAGLSQYCPNTYSDISEATYPCVIKRVDLNAGIGIALVDSLNDYSFKSQQAPWKNQSYILQEFIPGDVEYVAYCIMKNGRLLWNRVYSYELPEREIRKTGKGIKQVSLPDSVFEQVVKFMSPLNYSGPCNIDFKIKSDGTISIFEINPRLGGALMRPEFVGDLASALGCIIENAYLERPSFFSQARTAVIHFSNWLFGVSNDQCTPKNLQHQSQT